MKDSVCQIVHIYIYLYRIYLVKIGAPVSRIINPQQFVLKGTQAFLQIIHLFYFQLDLKILSKKKYINFVVATLSFRFMSLN